MSSAYTFTTVWLVLCFSLLGVTPALAQNQEAYIVRDGSMKSGVDIPRVSFHLYSNSVSLYPTVVHQSNDLVTYSPEQVEEFGLPSGEVFIAHTVPTTQQKVFLQRLMKGEKEVYLYYTAKNTFTVYLKEKDGQPEPLPNDPEEFIAALENKLAACPYLNEQIQHLRYNYPSLKTFFQNYEACREVPVPHNRLFLSGGSHINQYFLPEARTSLVLGRSTSNFQAAAGVELPLLGGAISGVFGVQYSQSISTTDFTEQVFNSLYLYQLQIEQRALSGTAGVRVTQLGKRVSGYGQIDFIPTLYLTNNNILYHDLEDILTGETLSEGRQRPLPYSPFEWVGRFSAGLIFGYGHRFSPFLSLFAQIENMAPANPSPLERASWGLSLGILY
ncbi:MAG TPA: hypothetical protein DCE41_01380 [Cytophagales bacterium]|nr:hypothetical protein [Cytophagales bacterium]HAA22183.1 hypothetical protein [Cytophagales bacterium]HAP65062.1 hypothetical protein [Cytophagales bacterium]